MSEETFRCPVCDRVSHNKGDITHRFCVACHIYAEDVETDDIPCGRCAAPVRTFWLRNRGMLPRREVTLIANSVFHTQCWNALVMEATAP